MLSRVPILSVILPARNAEDTLGVALSSTLRAMPRNAELLVLDDASVDSTLQLARGYAARDQRIRIIHRTESRGVANGLNLLVAESRGRYIARMDADDICLPHRFRLQLRQIKRNSLDGVFGSVVHFGDSVRSFKPANLLRLNPRALDTAMLLMNPLAHSTALLDSRILREHPYRPGPAEDYDLWLRLRLSEFRLAKFSIPVVLYRRHSDQVTRSFEWQKRFAADELLQYHHGLLCRKLGVRHPSAVWALQIDPDSVDALMVANEVRAAAVDQSSFLRGYFHWRLWLSSKSRLRDA